jgi:hypothetical protein
MPGEPTSTKFDYPHITPTQFAGSSGPARGTRARKALAAQGRTLVERLLAAYRVGGLTPAEVAVLQALLGWVAGRGGEEAAGAAR